MTVPLIATQSELLSPWRAFRRPQPSPSHRVRPPSLFPVCPTQAPAAAVSCGVKALRARYLLAGVTFTANKVYTSMALQTQQLLGDLCFYLRNLATSLSSRGGI